MLAALLFALAACASGADNAAAPEQPAKKLSDVFATPDWAKFTSAKGPSQSAITPDDLISADGRCAGSPEPVAAATTDGNNPPPADSPLPPASPAAPTVTGGIGLSMTECQVAQRAGAPERVDIGAEGQERTLVLTYMRGPWPGIYRFRAGRLVSIERVEVPPEPKAKKPAKPAPSKKKARSTQQS